MTNDKFQMTNEIPSSNDEARSGVRSSVSSLGFRYSFGFRDSSFGFRNCGSWRAAFRFGAGTGTMTPPLTPPKRGIFAAWTIACSPPGRGRGWVGSWRDRIARGVASMTIAALFLIAGILLLTPASRCDDDVQPPSGDEGRHENVAPDELPRHSPQAARQQGARSEVAFKDRVTPHCFA